MTEIPNQIKTWRMAAPGRMERAVLGLPELQPDEVLVEIAGCGICRSDVNIFFGGLPTFLPRTLGHEISGTIVAGPPDLIGGEVIIPAVMPCHHCPICQAGRENRCLKAKIPGYTMGAYGGNASHIVVPAADLCHIPDRKGIPLAHLAVVADVVASAYQAAKRADIQPGDKVAIVGATGGAGVYATQICAIMGAVEVVGIARDEGKLNRALRFGATHVIGSKDKTAQSVRREFHAYCESRGFSPRSGWKIFEWSGSPAGQEIALELLPFTGKLVVAGQGTEPIRFQLGRLMALDAEVIGSWACAPRYYPEVLEMVLAGRILIEPFIRTMPMSRIGEAFDEARGGSLDRRIVMIPDF